jgi:hypothetical protein
MGLKKEFKVGDKVLCIKEDDIPEYIGTVWTVVQVRIDGLIEARYKNNKFSPFLFRTDEIVKAHPLLEELL